MIPFLMKEWNIWDGNLSMTATGSYYIFYYPMFIFGVIIADLETRPNRPIDKLRNLTGSKKVCMSLFLLFIALSFGSNTRTGNFYREDDWPIYWRIVTLNKRIPKWFEIYAAGLAWILLAMTSKTT